MSATNKADHLRKRLLRYLEYPDGWLDDGMYPSQFFASQLNAVLTKLGCTEAGFLRLPDTQTYGIGAEHFRAAVISHWLSRARAPEEKERLAALLDADPDKQMARAYLRELRQKG